VKVIAHTVGRGSFISIRRKTLHAEFRVMRYITAGHRAYIKREVSDPPPQYAAEGKQTSVEMTLTFEILEVQTRECTRLTLAERNGRYDLIHLPDHTYPILLVTLLIA